jgi:histidyl-tRNA synthetase
VLDGELEEIANVSLELLAKMDIDFTFQIANMAIAHILVKSYDFKLEDIKDIKLDKILSSKHSWIKDLVAIETVDDLKNLSKYPKDIAEELNKMLKLASEVEYKNIIISPLFYAPMRYYNSLVFRAFSANELFLIGGRYKIKDVNGVGFALYTDTIIAKKI